MIVLRVLAVVHDVLTVLREARRLYAGESPPIPSSCPHCGRTVEVILR